MRPPSLDFHFSSLRILSREVTSVTSLDTSVTVATVSVLRVSYEGEGVSEITIANLASVITHHRVAKLRAHLAYLIDLGFQRLG